ncbi:MAG TPA: IS110 family transposase [Gemmatimonadales bacterium]|jgi:transposase|nr:IS110 family transposase [Gemmatimonadales bacterium]
MELSSMHSLAAMIGLDWGEQRHDVALQAADSTTVETSRLEHDPAAIAAWLATLAERFPGAPIGIALETSRGAIVHALLEAPGIVLYPIQPRSLKRFRETFSPNGAKDDTPDARLLLALLVHHRAHLTPLHRDEAATRALDRLVRHRRALVEQRTQGSLRLQAALKEYFPLALHVAGTDLTTPLACDFLLRWPTLEALQRARAATVRTFYTRHQCRSVARITERLAAIATAVPLTTDPAIIGPTAHYVQALARQGRALSASIREFDTAIATAFAAHPDAALFQSVPGAGAVLAPRLLAAFGADRTRYPSPADVQQAAGIAPITIRSGKSCVVTWRWATSPFLRQTFHELAAASIAASAWARTYYARQRQRGKSHHTAVRALAFKWIRILWRCWQDRTPYDDARYGRALAERGSPLSARLLAPGEAA